MPNPTTIQDGWVSASDPSKSCSFDYEAIQEPTKPLMHQSARFWYMKKGRGTITVDGVEYAVKPNTLIAITPWKITNVTHVDETLQFIKVVYDYSYLNTVLKGVHGSSEGESELLRFLSMEPICYLDSIQAQYVDTLMEQLKAELGVESTCQRPPENPYSYLYTINKVVELIIMYRRYIMAARGEKETQKPETDSNSVYSYIYAHSSEKLTLGKVAGVFFTSESTLSKQISEMTGLTFSKLLSSIRIEKASDYLIYTDLTLDEIAKMVGFVDASHISKHFTTKVGITPMNYRKIYSKTKTKYNRTGKNVAFSITDYIFKNYSDEKLTASSVAAQFGVSVTEMNRLLLYHNEMNFEALLHYIRINKACELLASTDLLVIDVALEVGYNNVKTFNMNFFRYKQMTPSEFRNSVTLQKADGSETGGRKGKNKR